MPIYKQTTEITKIDDVWANIDRDIVEVYFGDKNIFTVWGEYDSSLPITINANGDALIDYRIYGTDGGVGVATESGEPAGYKLPMTVAPKNLFDKNAKDVDKGYVPGKVFEADGSLGYSTLYSVSEYMQVEPLKEYFLENFHNPVWPRAYGCACFYDSDKNVLSSIRASDADSLILLAPELARFIRISVYFPTCKFYNSAPQKENVYIGENQLDAIGEYSDYVDYGAQKIVRRIAKVEFDGSENWVPYQNCVYVGVPNYIKSIWGTTAGFSRSSHYTPSLEGTEIGTYCLGGLLQYKNTRWNGNIVINAGMTVTEYKAYLASQAAAGTPVTFWYVVEIPDEQDPPVPLPEIPTIDGTTVIDYDGDPKPSQMYVKYRKQYS